MLGPSWAFILKTFGISQIAVQIVLSPPDWEEAGSSGEAKLTTEVGVWS